jgi:hypothetical protein
MSISGLGQIAKCGTLDATTLEFTNQSLHLAPQSADITAPGDLTPPGALPTKGFHILAPAANPTAFTLPDGSRKGDIVEFLHRSGLFVANITPSNLHGAITVIGMTGACYVKLIWLGQQWYIIARCGDGAAAANAVANYPVLS